MGCKYKYLLFIGFKNFKIYISGWSTILGFLVAKIATGVFNYLPVLMLTVSTQFYYIKFSSDNNNIPRFGSCGILLFFFWGGDTFTLCAHSDCTEPAFIVGQLATLQ